MTEFERVAELLELIDDMSDDEILNILTLIKDHKKKILLTL
jgi:hypothetical protein